MKLSQIDYFIEVAQQLSFTAAAKSLYISQPALSKQIALLEEELDTQLFLRNSRKVTLTAAGKQFEKDLIELRQQLEEAQKRAVEIGKTEKQIFRIGCFDGAVIDDFLPAIYKHIHKLAPDMLITLFRGSFQENRKALEKDNIDLLLTLNLDFTQENESYRVRDLVQREAALVYSKNIWPKSEKKPAIHDFERETFLVLDRRLSPGLYQNSIDNIKKLGIKSPRIEEVANFTTLCTCLEMGSGYTLLTEDALKESASLERIPLEGIIVSKVIAVWKKNHPVTELFMDNFHL